MNYVVKKIITGLKISKPDRVELNKFLDLPDIQKILNGDEADRLARRRKLIAEKAGLPEKFKTKQAAAEKSAIEAAKRLEAAEIEVRAAREANRLASLINSGIGYSLGMQIKAIDQELLAGADPRIEDYRIELWKMESDVRLADNGWFAREEIKTKDSWGDERTYIDTVFRTNIEDVQAGMTAVARSIAELNEMKLAAMTTAEVTAALRKMTDDLIPVLNKLNGINPPWIDEFNEVRPPNEDGKPAYPHPLDAPQY